MRTNTTRTIDEVLDDTVNEPPVYRGDYLPVPRGDYLREDYIDEAYCALCGLRTDFRPCPQGCPSEF